MFLLHLATVILVLISPLSTFPLMNMTEQQFVNDSNVKPVSLNLSPLELNNNNISLRSIADVKSTARSSTRRTTRWPPYSSTNRPSSNSLTGGQTALLVIGGLLVFCCICCGGAYKSGHWETRKVWVSD